MTDWVDSLRLHIVANSLGTYGTNLFKGGLEDFEGVGDPSLGLVEYSGSTVETMAPGVALESPSLHIACRGSSYDTTRDRIEAVRNLLMLITNSTVEGTHFVRVKPKGTINYLKRDGSGRHQFSANFDVWL